MEIEFERKIIFGRGNLSNIKRPALFLDRDGVVIEDKHYLSSPDKVTLCLGIKKLIKNAYNKNFLIIIVTNQSGIGRGFLDWDDYEKITQKILKLLGKGNPINAIYANSYTDKNSGDWRKPNPGMINQAAKDLKINLNSSILIGDRESDMLAGINAGIKTLVHLLTGHGRSERDNILRNLNADKKKSRFYKKFKLLLLNDLNNFQIEIFDNQS